MAWYQITDSSNITGPIGTAPSPGIIFNGFSDATGSVWSVDSSNNLRQVVNSTNPWNNSLLARLGSNDVFVDSQQVTRITFAVTENTFILSRVTRSAGNTSGYMIGAYGNTGAQGLAFYKVVGGAITQIGTTVAITLSDATAYDFTTSTVQTNGTTTTLTLSVANVGGTVIGSASVTDTTVSLQSVSGGSGYCFIANSGAGSVAGTISRIRTYSDIAPTSATGYTNTIATRTANGQPAMGTLTLTGGTALTANLVITVTEDSNGTFSSVPVTIVVGNQSGTYTYTPQTGGARTLTTTHTGGNASMTGDGTTAVTVLGSTVLLDFTPTSGVLNASPSPGSIGNGFTDESTTGAWSVDASNILHQISISSSPWNPGLLARLGTPENLIESTQTVRITNSVTENPFILSRVSYSAGNATGYMMGYFQSGSIAFYSLSAGAPTSLVVQPITALSDATAYDFVVSTVQANNTTTTISLSIYTTTGTLVGRLSLADTTAGLQNISGGNGYCFNSTGSNIIPGSITRIRTFTYAQPVNATGYTLALPASIIAGVYNTVTANLSGGTLLASNLVITVTEDSTGTFIGVPATIASGSTSITFKWIPQTIGLRTLTATHTGGNAGMIGDAAYTGTAVSAILMNDASVVKSPWLWGGGNFGPTSIQSGNCGAYLRLYFKGTTNITILFDGASTTCSYVYQVDGGPLTASTLIPSNGALNVSGLTTGSHNICLYLNAVPSSNGRWTGQIYMGVYAINLNGGTTDLPSVVRYAKNFMFIGDSITESLYAANDVTGIDSMFNGWAFLMGQSLWSLGYEYGVIGWSGTGYSTFGWDVPPLYTAGNDTNTSYNKYIQGQSRLTGGKFTPAPDVIYENLGTNDALHGTTGAALQAIISGTYSALRAASSLTTKMLKVIPYAGYVRADIVAGINSYKTSAGDANVSIIDLGIDSRMTSGSYTSHDSGHIHPDVFGCANIASLALGAIVSTVSTISRVTRTSFFRR